MSNIYSIQAKELRLLALSWAKTVGLTLAIVTVLTHAGVSLAQELYIWEDENGVRHFSEKPPEDKPNLQSERLTSAPAPSGSVVESEQEEEETSPELAAEEPLREVVTKEVPVKKNAAECAKARESVQYFEQGDRKRVSDPETGEVRFLTEEESADFLQQWRQHRDRHC